MFWTKRFLDLLGCSSAFVILVDLIAKEYFHQVLQLRCRDLWNICHKVILQLVTGRNVHHVIIKQARNDQGRIFSHCEHFLPALQLDIHLVPFGPRYDCDDSDITLSILGLHVLCPIFLAILYSVDHCHGHCLGKSLT